MPPKPNSKHTKAQTYPPLNIGPTDTTCSDTAPFDESFQHYDDIHSQERSDQDDDEDHYDEDEDDGIEEQSEEDDQFEDEDGDDHNPNSLPQFDPNNDGLDGQQSDEESVSLSSTFLDQLDNLLTQHTIPRLQLLVDLLASPDRSQSQLGNNFDHSLSTILQEHNLTHQQLATGLNAITLFHVQQIDEDDKHTTEFSTTLQHLYQKHSITSQQTTSIALDAQVFHRAWPATQFGDRLPLDDHNYTKFFKIRLCGQDKNREGFTVPHSSTMTISLWKSRDGGLYLWSFQFGSESTAYRIMVVLHNSPDGSYYLDCCDIIAHFDIATCNWTTLDTAFQHDNTTPKVKDLKAEMDQTQQHFLSLYQQRRIWLSNLYRQSLLDSLLASQPPLMPLPPTHTTTTTTTTTTQVQSSPPTTTKLPYDFSNHDFNLTKEDLLQGIDRLDQFGSHIKTDKPNVHFYAGATDVTLHSRYGAERFYHLQRQIIIKLAEDSLKTTGHLFKLTDKEPCYINKNKILLMSHLWGMDHPTFNHQELDNMITMVEANYAKALPNELVKPKLNNNTAQSQPIDTKSNNIPQTVQANHNQALVHDSTQPGWYTNYKPILHPHPKSSMYGHHAIRTGLRYNEYYFYLVMTRSGVRNGLMKRGATRRWPDRLKDYGNEIDIKAEHSHSAIKSKASGLIENTNYSVVNTLMPINGRSEYGLCTKEMFMAVRTVLSWLQEYNNTCPKPPTKQ